MAQSIASTVARAVAGDLDAFADIVRRYQDVAFAYALALLGDHHRAEDAAQEAFVEAHRSLGRLETPEAFPGWLRGIVRHRCLRYLRRRDVGLGVLDEEVPSLALAPDAAALRRERVALVLAAVRELPRPLCEAVTLHYLCDCTHEEAAGFLGVPRTTLNNRLHHARRLMKRRILTMVAQTLSETGLPDDFAAAKALMCDPLFLEYLACRAIAPARARLREFAARRLPELAPEERTTVGRARRLERFLTTPFFVAADVNGRPGRSIPLSDTLDGVEAILDGAYDDVPEERFVFVGAAEEARAARERA